MDLILAHTHLVDSLELHELGDKQMQGRLALELAVDLDHAHAVLVLEALGVDDRVGEAHRGRHREDVAEDPRTVLIRDPQQLTMITVGDPLDQGRDDEQRQQVQGREHHGQGHHARAARHAHGRRHPDGGRRW